MAKQVKKAAKKKAVKKAPKKAAKGGKKAAKKVAKKAKTQGVTEAQVKRQLKIAAKALNHPHLRPPRGKKAAKGSPLALLGASEDQEDIILFTPFCITEKKPVSSPTQDQDDAQAAADHHQEETGHNVKVIASN